MKIVFLGATNPEKGRMIKAVAKVQDNYEVLGFIDNDPAKKNTTFLGYPVFGGFEVLKEIINEDIYFVNLITGSTETRYETSLYMAKNGCKFANFIHPSVDLSMVELDVGNYIQQNVIVQADVQIGNNSSIDVGTLVGHESTIGNSVFIAHGCNISGLVKIEDGVFMGTNSTILPRIRIGKWSTIGAGSVVIKDVPDYSVVFGNPARIMLSNEKKYSNGNIFEDKN